MAVDLSVFQRLKGKAAFDREAQEFDMRKQLAQAELKKSQQLDIDQIGEMAFYKAAQGIELSPQEIAAAQVVDAKSGGVSFNPVTGELMQKPRLSDKIGIGGLPKPATLNQGMEQPTQSDNFDYNAIPRLSVDDLNSGQVLPTPTSPIPLPPTGMKDSMTPVNQRDLYKQNVEADRKRLDEVIASAGTANKAKSTAQRMQTLQGGLGYTGTGAPVLAAIDKVLTPLNAPDLIAGNPADRENFAKESVSDWVTQVEPLKGALTEQEGARFDKATANLSMTPEGIKKMTDLTIALGERASQKSQFYQDYFNQNGSLYGADSVWEQYASQNPITVLEDSMTQERNPIAESQNAIIKRQQQVGVNPNQRNELKPLPKAQEAEAIFNAKKAIQKGKDPAAVRQRLLDNGIDPAKAGL